MLQKKKRVKLTGKKLRELNQKIFERDNYRCIVCGKYVDDSHKFHHDPCGQDKTDRLKEIRDKCRRYLKNIYG
jgi:hypothetical protein